MRPTVPTTPASSATCSTAMAASAAPEQRVASVSHRHSSRVTRLPRHRQIEALGTHDPRDNAQGLVGVEQQRSLLDVCLEVADDRRGIESGV